MFSSANYVTSSSSQSQRHPEKLLAAIPAAFPPQPANAAESQAHPHKYQA